jgi:hypothetical protein
MKKYLSGLLMLMLSACSGNGEFPGIPDEVVPIDTMAMVLRDIHGLESALMVSAIRQDSARNLYRELEPEVFLKYKMDTARFGKSLRFYAGNPMLLDSLYRVVLKKTDSSAIFQP